MPRNASGVYSLPVASYVAGTTIKSADMNSNLSDIATALTQSLATTGVTPMTGPILAASGSLAAPSYAFNSAATTGFYLAGANQIGIVTAGVLAATINSNQTTTWIAAATFNASVSIGTTLGVTGAATLSSTLHLVGAGTFDAALTVGTTLGVTGKASFTSTDSMAVANGTTGQRNGAPSAGDFRYNSTTASLEYWNGTAWVQISHGITVQKFTSGSGNYVPPTGVQRIRVRMAGGGGGGGAVTANNGSNGNDSSFGTWTAIKGNGGALGGGVGGSGGTGGVNGTGTLIVRFDGGKGMGGSGGTAPAATAITSPGGMGGANPFGGGGASTLNVAGSNGAVNTGAGGGGGGITIPPAGSNTSGSGGGAGEYVEFWVDAPANPTAYVVGAGGNGGAAGTFAGGNGATGIIIIEEYYH